MICFVYEVRFYETPSGRKPALEYIRECEPDVRGKVLAAIDVLREVGFLPEPRSKAIRGVPKLRELRVKHVRGISRVFYVVDAGPCFVLLHGFTKKSDKTPERELATAVQRMKEYWETKR